VPGSAPALSPKPREFAADVAVCRAIQSVIGTQGQATEGVAHRAASAQRIKISMRT